LNTQTLVERNGFAFAWAKVFGGLQRGVSPSKKACLVLEICGFLNEVMAYLHVQFQGVILH
jgi:hypothetical protein